MVSGTAQALLALTVIGNFTVLFTLLWITTRYYFYAFRILFSWYINRRQRRTLFEKEAFHNIEPSSKKNDHDWKGIIGFFHPYW